MKLTTPLVNLFSLAIVSLSTSTELKCNFFLATAKGKKLSRCGAPKKRIEADKKNSLSHSLPEFFFSKLFSARRLQPEWKQERKLRTLYSAAEKGKMGKQENTYAQLTQLYLPSLTWHDFLLFFFSTRKKKWKRNVEKARQQQAFFSAPIFFLSCILLRLLTTKYLGCLPLEKETFLRRYF